MVGTREAIFVAAVILAGVYWQGNMALGGGGLQQDRTAGGSATGAVTGGSATGGSATGGSVTGGSAIGGTVTGGSARGGSATGGSVRNGRMTPGTATPGIAEPGRIELGLPFEDEPITQENRHQLDADDQAALEIVCPEVLQQSELYLRGLVQTCQWFVEAD